MAKLAVVFVGSVLFGAAVNSTASFGRTQPFSDRTHPSERSSSPSTQSLLQAWPLEQEAPVRRVLAVLFPELLTELAHQSAVEACGHPLNANAPRAVVLLDNELSTLESQSVIDAVTPAAFARGIVPGLDVAQALSLSQDLLLQTLTRQRLVQALKSLTEQAQHFGTPVSFESPDTVWVDISGSSHLFNANEGQGGEVQLCQALLEHFAPYDHSCRLAVSNGPWSAQAFARFFTSPREQGEPVPVVVPSALVAARIGQLPSSALPLSPRSLAWLNSMGLSTISALRRLPTADLLARLKGETQLATGTQGRRLHHLATLIQGHDSTPLISYRTEELPEESTSWDEPLERFEQLWAPLVQLAERLSAQLETRGQGARKLTLTLTHDHAVAKCQNSPPEEVLTFSLTTPLLRLHDLQNILLARLERHTLSAPTVALRLQASALTTAPQWQLPLEHSVFLGSAQELSRDPRAFGLLVAELETELGAGNVGFLQVNESPLLEKGSLFLTTKEHLFSPSASFRSFGCSPSVASEAVPTRLIQPPICLRVPVQENVVFNWQGQTYCMTHVKFEQRLEGVEWWLGSPIHRDYFRIWLHQLNDSSTGAGAPNTSPSIESHPIEPVGLSLLAFVEVNPKGESSSFGYAHALVD